MTRKALHITLHKSPTIPKLDYRRYTSDSCVKGSIIRQYYIGSNAKQGAEKSNTLVYTSMRRDIMSPEDNNQGPSHVKRGAAVHEQAGTARRQIHKEKRSRKRLLLHKKENANGWYNEGTKNKWEDAEMRRSPGKVVHGEGRKGDVVQQKDQDLLLLLLVTPTATPTTIPIIMTG